MVVGVRGSGRSGDEVPVSLTTPTPQALRSSRRPPPPALSASRYLLVAAGPGGLSSSHYRPAGNQLPDERHHRPGRELSPEVYGEPLCATKDVRLGRMDSRGLYSFWLIFHPLGA